MGIPPLRFYRQQNYTIRAFAWFAFDSDFTHVTFHNPVYNRHSKACAVFLCCVKGFKHSVLIFLFDSTAIIAYPYFKILFSIYKSPLTPLY